MTPGTSDRSLAEIVEGGLGDLERFTGSPGPADDVTLVGLEPCG